MSQNQDDKTRPTRLTLSQPGALYLELLKRVLTRFGFDSGYRSLEPRTDLRGRFLQGMNRLLRFKNFEIVRRVPFDPELRRTGGDWPSQAETMIGLERLKNLEDCILRVEADSVPGDLIETGVWRGGACIFMAAVLRVIGCTSRRVWLADSFEGLPRPSGKYEADVKGDQFWKYRVLSIPEDEVVANFQRYDLWDPDRVRILKGWFSETLPHAPMQQLSILRLDGDMYESTTDALESLYPKLSRGGFCIVDDYGRIRACAEAVEDYRARSNISEQIEWVDSRCVFWRKTSSTASSISDSECG